MLRAGVTGTNWTGKTETVRRFIEFHRSARIESVALSSFVHRCPYPMGREQTIEASRWITEEVRGIFGRTEAMVQMFDRTPVDILAFTLYIEDRTGTRDKTTVDSIVDLVGYFDALFYLRPSRDWPVGVHPTKEDLDFARQMDGYIVRAMQRYSIRAEELPWDFADRQEVLAARLLAGHGL